MDLLRASENGLPYSLGVVSHEGGGLRLVDTIVSAEVELIIPAGQPAKAELDVPDDGFSIGVAAPLHVIVTDNNDNPLVSVNGQLRVRVADADANANHISCTHANTHPAPAESGSLSWVIEDFKLSITDVDSESDPIRPQQVAVTIECGDVQLTNKAGNSDHIIAIASSSEPHHFEIIASVEPRPPIVNLSLMTGFKMRMVDDQGFSFPMRRGERVQCRSRVRLAGELVWSGWSKWMDALGEDELVAPAVFCLPEEGAATHSGIVEFDVRLRQSDGQCVSLPASANNCVDVVVLPNRERVIKLELVDDNPTHARVGDSARVRFRVVAEGGGTCNDNVLSSIASKCKVVWRDDKRKTIYESGVVVSGDRIMAAQSPTNRHVAGELTYSTSLVWKPPSAYVHVAEDAVSSEESRLTIEAGAASRWEVSLINTPDEKTIRSGMTFGLDAVVLDAYDNQCANDKTHPPTLSITPMAAAAAADVADPWSVSGPSLHDDKWRFQFTIKGKSSTVWVLCLDGGGLPSVQHEVTMDPGELNTFELVHVSSSSGEECEWIGKPTKADAEASPLRANSDLVCTLIKTFDGQGNPMDGKYGDVHVTLSNSNGTAIKSLRCRRGEAKVSKQDQKLWSFNDGQGEPFTFFITAPLGPHESGIKAWFHVRAAPLPPTITSITVPTPLQLRAGDDVRFDPIVVTVTLSRAIDCSEEGSADELDGVNSALDQLTAKWHNHASGKPSVRKVDLSRSMLVSAVHNGHLTLDVPFTAANVCGTVTKAGDSNYWLEVSAGETCTASVKVHVKPADSHTYGVVLNGALKAPNKDGRIHVEDGTDKVVVVAIDQFNNKVPRARGVGMRDLPVTSQAGTHPLGMRTCIPDGSVQALCENVPSVDGQYMLAHTIEDPSELLRPVTVEIHAISPAVMSIRERVKDVATRLLDHRDPVGSDGEWANAVEFDVDVNEIPAATTAEELNEFIEDLFDFANKLVEANQLAVDTAEKTIADIEQEVSDSMLMSEWLDVIKSNAELVEGPNGHIARVWDVLYIHCDAVARAETLRTLISRGAIAPSLEAVLIDSAVIHDNVAKAIPLKWLGSHGPKEDARLKSWVAKRADAIGFTHDLVELAVFALQREDEDDAGWCTYSDSLCCSKRGRRARLIMYMLLMVVLRIHVCTS